MSDPDQLYNLTTTEDASFTFVSTEFMEYNSLRGKSGGLSETPSIHIFGDILDTTNVPAPTPRTLFIKKGRKGADFDTMEQWEKEAIGLYCERDKEEYINILKLRLKHHPKTPSGWNGPHLLKFTSGCCRGIDGKPIKFQDYEDAVSAANDIEECGGITLTTEGYSLRKKKKAKYGKWGDMYVDSDTYYGSVNGTLGSQIMCWVKE